ncbi:MAG: peptide-methionine (S)-S-oxide reductase MsrA [Chitinophagales bacterium]|nr:peptide-methionine (S)-S-oxide reductase MsrA [Chitinophagales bacterium]
MSDNNKELATLGAGCFWCVETIFKRLNGVISVESGYSGGHVENPTYEEVCGKKTGHAEVIRIEFNPEIVSYEEILEVFWAVHDPTTLNKQGNDIGPQYRSVIFYHDSKQRESAIQSKSFAASLHEGEIVTEISQLINYYKAENYHQDYFVNNPQNSYCSMVISPKVQKFLRHHSDKLKAEAN